MSRSALNCPNCKRALGYRRRGGNIAILVALEFDSGTPVLVCSCGHRSPQPGMVPLLIAA